MSWQRVPPFQPCLQVAIDPDASFHRVRNPGFPSLSEIKQISQSIAEAEKDILDYDQDITSLRELLLTLEKKRDNLKKYISHSKSYCLSIIRRLPTEIMAEIFLLSHCQDWYENVECGWRYLSTRPPILPLTPLRLGRVCKLWHTIARGTPRLWSMFSVIITRGYHPGFTLKLLNVYLLHSDQHPLTLKIFLDDHYFRGDGFPKRAALMLIKHSHRWSEINFHKCLDPSRETQRVLSLKRDLPLLRNLTLTGFYEDDLELGIFAGASSSLEKVTLTHIRGKPDHLPLQHVHHLCLESIGLNNNDRLEDFLKSVVKDCSQLRFFEFGLSRAKCGKPEATNTRVPLKRLEHLCLKSMNWNHLNAFLSVFTLPLLHRFSWYAAPGESATIGNNQFSLLVSRSNCSLSVLELINLWSPSGLCDMLRSVPSLTELTVVPLGRSRRSKRVLPTLVQILHVPDIILPNIVESDLTAEIFLPNLQKLTLEVVADEKDYDEFALADMIQSRWYLDNDRQTSVCCLKIIRLVLPVNLPRENLVKRLQPLKDAGLAVEIEEGNTCT
ncbi:hypothetical protein VKT23_001608 [Stygiomarasmius scandens]|uniref:F-box domain-containing protein n=1 Tax=Marasmiellus scandens TaxID=2682957 RepID=A0ABR1K209_9AGAR